MRSCSHYAGDFGDLYGAAFLDGSADQEADASGRPGVGER